MSIMESGLDFEARIANSQFKKDLDEIRADVRGMKTTVVKEAGEMSGAFMGISQQATLSMKDSINRQKQLIKEIEADIKSLQKTVDSSSGKQKNMAMLDLGGAKKALAEEQATLLGLQQQQISLNSKEVESQNPLVSGLKKWAFGLATVSAAMKVGKDIIDSSKSSADQFQFAVSGMQSGLSYFYKTIVSGDWTDFFKNIKEAISVGYEYAEMMDKVKQQNWAVTIAEANAEGKGLELEAKMRNKQLSTEERRKAGQERIDLEKELAAKRTVAATTQYNADLSVATKRSKLSKETLMSILSDLDSESKARAEKYNKTLKEAQSATGTKNYGDISSASEGIKLYAKALRGEGNLTDKMIDNVVSSFVKLESAKASALKNTKRVTTMVNTLSESEESEAAAKAKKAQEEANNRSKDQINYDTKIGRQRIDNQIAIEQGLLDLQKDSAEKQRAQADLDYRKTLNDIAKQKADLLKEYNELNGGIDKKTGKKTSKYVSKLQTEDQSQIDQKIILAEKVRSNAIVLIKEKEAEKLKVLWDQVQGERDKSIGEETAQIKKKYDKEVEQASGNGVLILAIENNRSAAIQTLRTKYALSEIDFNEQIEVQKATLSSNNEDELQKKLFEIWAKYQKQKIESLRAAGKVDDAKQADLLEAALKVGIKNEGLNETDKIYKDIVDSASRLVEGVRQFNSVLADSISLALNLGETLYKAFDTKKPMTKENAYSSIASGATELISIVANQAAQNKRIMDEYYQSIIRQQQEYNLALNEQIRLNADINGSVFLKDYEGKLVSGTKAYNDAQSKFAEEYKKFLTSEAIVGKKNVINGNNVLAGAGAGAALGAGIGSIVPGIGTAIGAAVGGVIGALTGLFAKKKKDVVAPLLQTYPDLIKANGEFNADLAKTLIANNKVTESTKSTLQNLIDWKDAADKATAQLKQVVSDIAGSLGDDLRSALVSAFENGTDAAQAFGDSVNKILENIVSNMIFNKVFEGALKTLQDEMTASYGTGGDQSMTDDIGRFFSKYPDLIKQFNLGMSEAQQQASGVGLSVFKQNIGTASSTLAGSIQRDITEQTAGELAGITRKMSDDLRRIVMNSDKGLDFNKVAVDHFASISRNTFNTVEELKKCNVKLDNISTDVYTTAKNTKPVTVRSVGL